MFLILQTYQTKHGGIIMRSLGHVVMKIVRLLCICVVILAGCLWGQHSTSAASAGTNVLFILDGSGSMWGRLDNVEKIVIAKKRMVELVQELEGVNMGLIVYGHRRKGDCDDIEMMVPLGAGNKEAVIQQIQSINPKGKTPITKSIQLAAQHLETIEEETEIVLVSDGLETCEGDPCAYVKTLKQKGIKFTLDVVGFDVSDEEREQLECIAKAGGGRYFTAQNTMQLKEAFTEVKKEVIKKQEISPSSLVGKWSFGRSQEGGQKVQQPLCNLTLTDTWVTNKGYVIKSCHQNESYWELVDDELLFRHKDGQVTTRFKRISSNYWEGPYFVHPDVKLEGVTHYLRRQ
jgi:hypothetical protein